MSVFTKKCVTPYAGGVASGPARNFRTLVESTPGNVQVMEWREQPGMSFQRFLETQGYPYVPELVESWL